MQRQAAQSYHQPRDIAAFDRFICDQKSGFLKVKLVERKTNTVELDWNTRYISLRDGVLFSSPDEDGTFEDEIVSLSEVGIVKTARTLGSPTVICLHGKTKLYYFDAGNEQDMNEWLLSFHKAIVTLLNNKYMESMSNRFGRPGRSRSGDLEEAEDMPVWLSPSISTPGMGRSLYSRSASASPAHSNGIFHSALGIDTSENADLDEHDMAMDHLVFDQFYGDSDDLQRIGTRDLAHFQHSGGVFSPRSESGIISRTPSFSDDESIMESSKRCMEPYEVDLSASSDIPTKTSSLDIPAPETGKKKYVPPHLREGFVAEEMPFEDDISFSNSLSKSQGSRERIPSLRERFGSMSFSDETLAAQDQGIFGRAVSQGSRPTMEDCDCAEQFLRGKPLGFYGVFDGHMGVACAQLARETIMDHCVEYENGSMFTQWPEGAKAALLHGFASVESNFIKKAKEEKLPDGSCALVALVHYQNMNASADSVMVANLGDSRAVLYHNGVITVLTTEHSPMLEEERQRIEDMQGWVTVEVEMTTTVGRFARVAHKNAHIVKRLLSESGFKKIGRVNGELAVSRALGDLDYKDPYHNDYAWFFPRGHAGSTDRQNFKFQGDLVDPTPDITVENLDPPIDKTSKSFLILACDGLWEVLNSEEAVEICLECQTPQMASDSLVDTALNLASSDNVTALVISLKHNGSKF